MYASGSPNLTMSGSAACRNGERYCTHTRINVRMHARTHVRTPAHEQISARTRMGECASKQACGCKKKMNMCAHAKACAHMWALTHGASMRAHVRTHNRDRTCATTKLESAIEAAVNMCINMCTNICIDMRRQALETSHRGGHLEC